MRLRVAAASAAARVAMLDSRGRDRGVHGGGDPSGHWAANDDEPRASANTLVSQIEQRVKRLMATNGKQKKPDSRVDDRSSGELTRLGFSCSAPQ